MRTTSVMRCRRLAHPYRYAVLSTATSFSGASGYPGQHHPRSRNSRVSIDEQHVALPKLYGAPAYARPPVLVPRR